MRVEIEVQGGVAHVDKIDGAGRVLVMDHDEAEASGKPLDGLSDTRSGADWQVGPVVLIEVSGGVAEVVGATAPASVQITDHDGDKAEPVVVQCGCGTKPQDRHEALELTGQWLGLE